MGKKAFLGCLLLVFCLLSLFVGAKGFNLHDLIENTNQSRFLLATTRFPRTISLILAGSTLSICGLLMQHLMQNKFVSPTTAGTMDSARLGMVVVLLFFPKATPLLKMGTAFSFGLLGTLFFLFLARFLPGKNTILLPLVGVMFGNVVGSLGTFLAYEKNLIQNVSSWLQGNFATVMKGNYELLWLTVPVFVAIYLFARYFAVLGLGESTAKSLGISYEKMQFFAITLVAFASATVLVSVGNLPFLGVIIPNLVTYFKGDSLKENLSVTAISGSLFLLVCDVFSRVVIAPYEMPVSVVAGSIGSLLFLVILFRQAKEQS